MSKPATVQALVRRTHEQRVLAVLRECGVMSRAQIADRTGLSRTTLSEITARLIASGAITVARTDLEMRRGSGRPAELLAIDPGAGQFVGVDIGHGRVRVAIADASHEIVATGVSTYAVTLGWEQRQEITFRLLEEVAAAHHLHFGALQGIAVGVAGPDAGRREQMSRAFSARFGCAVLIDNNTQFAALAEATAEAAGLAIIDDLAYVRISEGIGGGLIVGGRLVSGGLGVAGEFGHIRVDLGADAARCRCGKLGCLETIASMPAVLAAAGVDDVAELGAALADGTSAARGAVDRAAGALGKVLADTALVLSPARIVLGGELPRVAPDVVTLVAATVCAELEAVGSACPLVRAARLDDTDGALGAVAALHRRSPLLADYQLAPAPEHWRNRA